MIGSFRGRYAEAVAAGRSPKGFPTDLVRPAQRKLVALIAATDLQSLASPPGNRLEALRGERKGQHSIRINDQWRVCFRWVAGHAEEVEIVDYH
jgi:proteic killer suppression protein